MTKHLLNAQWIARFEAFTQLIVGFSGGLDSTVALHVLASLPSLRKKLVALYVNHGISPNASLWQKHCEQFCQHLDIPFISRSVAIDCSANVEEEARKVRYAVFSSLLGVNDCLILGHHLDDQAETVLLNLFRGAGVDGLAAMPEWNVLGAGTLARPFLSYSRKELEHYAAAEELKWIEDESNQDIHYSRNYLRHQIMPLLAEKWSGVAGNIARTATHCQQARANLEELALQDSMGLLSPTGALLSEPLKSLSFERLSNVLRFWLKKNQLQLPSTATFQRLIHEVLFASPDAIPIVSWDNIEVRRYREFLYLDKLRKMPQLPASIEWLEFPLSLTLADFSIRLNAKKAEQGLIVPENAAISVRFRQGGETLLWHGQTKQLKKLFQGWGIPPWLRDTIPLIYIDDQLAAVVGYAISDLFFTTDAAVAWHVDAESYS